MANVRILHLGPNTTCIPRWGFASGVTQILKFLLGVTQILAFLDTNMLYFQGEILHWGSKPAQGPNMNVFASQRNIGVKCSNAEDKPRYL